MNRLAKIWATVGLRLPNLADICACRYPRSLTDAFRASLNSARERAGGSPLWALILLGSSVGVCTLFGATIDIFNTGEGPGGSALAVGQADPHYSLISAPSGVPLTATTTSPNAVWASNTATADWINPYGSAYVSAPVGSYDYQTTFSLAGLNPATAELSGSWATDNDACIYLNGVNTGVCTPVAGFGSLAPFSITSGFQVGVNTLDFVVTNEPGTSIDPTGVIAEIGGTASRVSGAPEPSSLPLMGIGLLGLSLLLRRKCWLITTGNVRLSGA